MLLCNTCVDNNESDIFKWCRAQTVSGISNVSGEFQKPGKTQIVDKKLNDAL